MNCRPSAFADDWTPQLRTGKGQRHIRSPGSADRSGFPAKHAIQSGSGFILPVD